MKQKKQERKQERNNVIIPYFVKMLKAENERSKKVLEYLSHSYTDYNVQEFQTEQYFVQVYDCRNSLTLAELLKIFQLQNKINDNDKKFLKFLSCKILIEYDELNKRMLRHQRISPDNILIYGKDLQILPSFRCGLIFSIKFINFDPKEMNDQQRDFKQLRQIIGGIAGLRQEVDSEKKQKKKEIHKNELPKISVLQMESFEVLLNNYQDSYIGEIKNIDIKLSKSNLIEEVLEVLQIPNQTLALTIEIGFIQEFYFKNNLNKILNKKESKEINVKDLMNFAKDIFSNFEGEIQKIQGKLKEFTQKQCIINDLQFHNKIVDDAKQKARAFAFTEFHTFILQYLQNEDYNHSDFTNELFQLALKPIQFVTNKITYEYFKDISTQIVQIVEKQL